MIFGSELKVGFWFFNHQHMLNSIKRIDFINNNVWYRLEWMILKMKCLMTTNPWFILKNHSNRNIGNYLLKKRYLCISHYGLKSDTSLFRCRVSGGCLIHPNPCKHLNVCYSCHATVSLSFPDWSLSSSLACFIVLFPWQY